jgi:anti-sigma B factor antagonist
MTNTQTPHQVTSQGGKSVFKPGGDITASNAPEIRAALKELIGEGVKDLTMDLSDTHMIDSSGIGLLVATYNSLTRLEGKMAVINATPELLGLFKAFRLDKHFPISVIPGME